MALSTWLYRHGLIIEPLTPARQEPMEVCEQLKHSEPRLGDVNRILFLHGYTSQRPAGHWMRLSAAALRNHGHQVWYPQFPNPDFPKTQDWQALLAQESKMMDEVLGGDKIVIAHSLGAVNWLLGALTDRFDKPFDRVLLVAIPDPIATAEAPGIEGEALDFDHPRLGPQIQKWGKSIQVLASDKDRWQPNGTAFYRSLELETTTVSGAGHFTLGDGYGIYSGLIDWVNSANPQDLQRH